MQIIKLSTKNLECLTINNTFCCLLLYHITFQSKTNYIESSTQQNSKQIIHLHDHNKRVSEISIQRRFFRPSEVKGLVAVLCALHSTPEGQNIIILSWQGQNFKMITSAKHEGYISVWARVRSTRVPNIIHHEGRGCKAYKDKRDRSFKILRYFWQFLKFCPCRYRITIFCPSGIGGKIETGCNHLRG